MRRAFLWALVGWMVLCGRQAELGAASVSDVVGGVSQAQYTGYLVDSLYTHAGDNRGSGAQHDLARTNILSTLQSFGLTTTLWAFAYNSTTYYNVVATKTGTTRPQDIYIVGAHYDSVNNPGADDNASGVAGVLEAARALAAYEFEATILFMAFDREEQGLIGSRAWAAAHSSDQIRGMISLDMLAYNPAGSSYNKANVYGRTTGLSPAVKTALADAVTTYGNGITPVIGGDLPYSDHAAFEENNFGAALLIEAGSNPYYHTASDNVDTANYIDYAYATNLTRSTVGYLAVAAVLVPEPAGGLALVGLLVILKRRKRCRLAR